MSSREEEAPLITSSDSAGPGTDAPPSLTQRTRDALRNPKKLNGLEKALAALAIFLLLLSATFSGLFAGEVVKYKRAKHTLKHRPPPAYPTATVTATSTIPGPTTTASPLPKHPGKNGEICLTGSCVKSAAKIISGLDTSVDPCQDFYLFANGGWLAEHPIPAGKSAYGTFNEVDDANKRIVRDIIHSKPDSSLPEADQRNLQLIQNFWKSCTDEEAVDKHDQKPLLDLFDEVIAAWRGESDGLLEEEEAVDGLRLQSDDLDFLSHHGKKSKKAPKKGGSKWDSKTKRERLTNALSFLHSRGVTALFENYVEGDTGGSPSTSVLWLSQAGLSLPSKDYYSGGDKEVTALFTSVAAEIIAEAYKARREQGIDAKDLAESVFKLEKQIAAISLDAADLDLPIPTYNPYNGTALQKLFPSISFANYFASYTPRPRYPEPVIVTSPGFFGNLSKLVEHTGPEVLEAYFVVQTALEYGDLLGLKQPIRKQVDLLSATLNGISPDERKPRDEICLDAALENFGFLLGRPYVQKAFPGQSKQYAEEIIYAIIDAFKTRLPGRTWLDEKTREKAKEKVEAIKVKIGYPTSPNTEDPVSLERYYSLNLPVLASDYFGNVLRSRVADERRKWVKVGRQVDPGEWEMVPSEVNAYFQPSANEIVFPAGILQVPFFSVDWPEFLNFGSFGAVAGHELSHSLDQAGRQYDKNGKLADWWSEETSKAFEDRQACFRKQYANYTIVGPDGKKYPIDSRLTGGEDGADSGGLAQAFTAWKARKDSDPHGKSYKNYDLPGLSEYTQEQLFFIAFAQGWARATTPGEALRRIRTDPHSPTQFRVMGPLSNSREFAAAWGCKVGTPLNRGDDKRCEIW
ncbi:hypothetical protein JCM8547_000924 [Rhodosporidiobolus lusitaniae]